MPGMTWLIKGGAPRERAPTLHTRPEEGIWWHRANLLCGVYPTPSMVGEA